MFAMKEIECVCCAVRDRRAVPKSTSFEDRKRAGVIAELEAVAQKHGYKLADLAGGKKAKVASPANYKHPEDSSLTWSGRGRQPNWIRDELSTGKSLIDFAI
jgi:DNA-binding protein H-NS